MDWISTSLVHDYSFIFMNYTIKLYTPLTELAYSTIDFQELTSSVIDEKGIAQGRVSLDVGLSDAQNHTSFSQSDHPKLA